MDLIEDMMSRIPAEVFHPMEFIQEELDARGWSLERLAIEMGGDDLALNLLALQMYDAVREPNCRIGSEMAEQLGNAFDVSPEFFLNLEAAWLKGQMQ